MSGTIRRWASSSRISKIMQPIFNMARDYYVTFSDVGQFSRKHPLKTGLYLSTLAAAGYLWRKRPDFDSYTDSVVSWSNEITLVPESIRNKKSQRYVEGVFLLLDRNKLFYLNLGILALIIERRQYPDLKSYHETCSMLRKPWYMMYRNVVDIGVVGRWIHLDEEMREYDINDEEWEGSQSMRTNH